jgi:spermidine synthase
MRLALLAVFFCSGAAGLVYEVLWTRHLSLIFGVTVYAVATVLSVFMGGLGLGSFLLGRWVDRRANPVYVYALLEGAIGLYALLVPTCFDVLRPIYVALRQADLPPGMLTAARALLAGLVLLPPTILMGGTFPVLVRALVASRDELGSRTGLLYFVNTAGAIAGTLAAGFILIERLGLRGTGQAAAAINFGAAFAAAALGRRIGIARMVGERSASAADREAHSNLERWIALAAIGLSGFASLAYQVLWTRALLRYVYNTTYAFTVVLATFLVGIALGGWLYTVFLAHRRRRLLVFAALELGAALAFVLSSRLFLNLEDTSTRLLGSPIIESFGAAVVTMFVRAALILLVPTTFLGATLPVAVDVCAGRTGAGHAVGRVYGVNTLGAILGSLAAGFVLIPGLGMQSTLAVLIALNILTATVLVAAERARWPSRVAVAGGLVVVLAAALLAVPNNLFRVTFGTGQTIVFYREGATDTVAVTEVNGVRTIFYDDHRGTAATNTFRWNFFLGHLPMLLHPAEPRLVLHICFGVGNSLSAMAAHDSVERVDSVELSPHVLKAAQYFWTNNRVLENPKVRMIIDDGRNFVMASRETYDVIELEPPETFTAGVISLYTREFYRDAAARLADDGIMVQWVPYGEAPIEQERMLFRAFQEVFPHATAWRQLEVGPLLFIGTKRPFTIDYQRLREKMMRPRIRRDLDLVGIEDVDHLLSLFLLDAPAFTELALGAPPVTDDRTVLDFSMPRYLGSGFGFGSFTPFAVADGHGIPALYGQRADFYFERRRPVLPYLTNLGGEAPATVGARIEARTKRHPSSRPMHIPEHEWRRW